MFIILYLMYLCNSVESQSIYDMPHKTSEAEKRSNNMWCYACHSMSETGDMCVENITANVSTFFKKCKDDEFICMVQKYSYTTSTENSTSSQKLWSLERRCASNCEAGCIVIGERTKLYACTSCCKTSYCNTDKGAAAKLSTTPNNPIETFIITIFIMILTKLLATPNYNCLQTS
ncbi:uncharacterized protein LOC116339471 [Contarinia nasturtii]|uniref:uncharacterized protein LOC116339471 n=1 Tax=Contarinia nasturtii TaxID=265458 RepID=UPI0012D40898|nr:uncharacterized protein LOC116339471 [Contarinia nasturtii]